MPTPHEEGLTWVNHHTVFQVIARVDRTLLFLNLVLLKGVAALPWPAAVVAAYLREGHAAKIALAVYGMFMVFHALVFQGMWWHLTRTGHLFADEVDVEAARATRARFALGTVVYPITVGLAFVSAPLTLAVHGLLAVYYAFNQVPIPTKAEAGAAGSSSS